MRTSASLVRLTVLLSVPAIVLGTCHSAMETAAPPTFSPSAGVYSTAQTVTLSSATAGATIYYTTDGSAPSASSTRYTSPIRVFAKRTLRAVAARSGLADSAAATGVYAIYVLDYASTLSNSPVAVQVQLTALDPATGIVSANGVDITPLRAAFTWDWGDGTQVDGWFPQQHTYADRSKNYILTVASHPAVGSDYSASTVVRFTAPRMSAVSLPSISAVTIPSQVPSLTTRLYNVPSSVTFFADVDFAVTPRSAVEQFLTASAAIQMNLIGGDVVKPDGTFQQIMLKDPGGGMYSIWYTTPIAFSGGSSMTGAVPCTSLLHEMAHNATLNYPAAYQYGGRIDGNANAIYSETMAQLFQHVVALELVNNAYVYGIPEDLQQEIALSALSSMGVVQSAYLEYTAAGNPYTTWYDSSAATDWTFGTFMTVAHVFFVHAQSAGGDGAVPLKRMMRFLSHFNATWAADFSAGADNPTAEAYRATLMTAALSCAFSSDLRSELQGLGFPVDATVYGQLMASAGS